MNTAKNTVSSIDALPKDEHWAVLVNETLQYDDGYGGRGSPSYSSINYMSYITFQTERDLQDWIIENDENKYGSKKVFAVIKVKPANVVKTVKINVGF